MSMRRVRTRLAVRSAGFGLEPPVIGITTSGRLDSMNGTRLTGSSSTMGDTRPTMQGGTSVPAPNSSSYDRRPPHTDHERASRSEPSNYTRTCNKLRPVYRYTVEMR
jgi:hypothetical protein